MRGFYSGVHGQEVGLGCDGCDGTVRLFEPLRLGSDPGDGLAHGAQPVVPLLRCLVELGKGGHADVYVAGDGIHVGNHLLHRRSAGTEVLGLLADEAVQTGDVANDFFHRRADIVNRSVLLVKGFAGALDVAVDLYD